MSKGIGKLQSDILHTLEDTKAGITGLNTFLIAFHTRRVIKPTQFIEDGVVADPTPESRARYHASIQSIRRALRTLHERDLVVKLYDDYDKRRYIWMARSVYDRIAVND